MMPLRGVEIYDIYSPHLVYPENLKKITTHLVRPTKEFKNQQWEEPVLPSSSRARHTVLL